MVIIRILAVAFLVLGGCSKDSSMVHVSPNADVVEFQIGAERIEAPLSIAPTEKIVVSIYGTIGHNGGYQFNRMETVETNSKMVMTAIGTIDKSGRAVTQAEVNWRGREFTKNPPHVDPVKIVFNQPDGTILEKTVVVKPR